MELKYHEMSYKRNKESILLVNAFCSITEEGQCPLVFYNSTKSDFCNDAHSKHHV